MMMTGYDLLKS